MDKTKKTSTRVLSVTLAIPLFLATMIIFNSITVQAKTTCIVRNSSTTYGYVLTNPETKNHAVIYYYLLPCRCSGNSIIPDAYKKVAIVNLFENIWSQMEDGTDITGSIEFTSDEDEFKDIYAYLDGLKATKTNEFAPNFTADFSFTNGITGENSYDFVFLGNRLVMRDPVGDCYIINISESKYSDLKNYIEEIRLDVNSEMPMVGAYSKDRAITDEELLMFEEVMDGLVGVMYEPTLVATQVVAGLNYRFTAIATPVVLDAESKNVYVYIYQPLEGSAVLDRIDDI